MPILKKEYKEKYTSIDNEILMDKNLDLRTLGLLIKMLSLPNDWEFSEKGLEALFEKDGQTSVRTGLKNLEKYGYLKREKVKGENGLFKGVEWTISEYPKISQKSEEKPRLENPNMVNPNLEEPNLENQPQYNTNQYNTKETKTKETNICEQSFLEKEMPVLEEFQKLWEIYPRKEGKRSALKHYKSAKKEGATYEQVKDGIERYKAFLKKMGWGYEYTKMGSTYFHGRLWEDEYEQEVKQSDNMGENDKEYLDWLDSLERR